MGFFICIFVSSRGFGHSWHVPPHSLCSSVGPVLQSWYKATVVGLFFGDKAHFLVWFLGRRPTFWIVFWGEGPLSQEASVLFLSFCFQCSGLQQRPNSLIALLPCKVVLLFQCLAPRSMYGDPRSPWEPGKGRGADGDNNAMMLHENCTWWGHIALGCTEMTASCHS